MGESFSERYSILITVNFNLCSFEGIGFREELDNFKDLVIMPEGFHPFPYRTRKLRPPGLMILGPQGPGKVSRRQVSKRETIF